jgi:hypothetical protein
MVTMNGLPDVDLSSALFDHASELTVDEKVERMIQEKERRDTEAWTVMPRLFDIWGKPRGLDDDV